MFVICIQFTLENNILAWPFKYLSGRRTQPNHLRSGGWFGQTVGVQDLLTHPILSLETWGSDKTKHYSAIIHMYQSTKGCQLKSLVLLQCFEQNLALLQYYLLKRVEKGSLIKQQAAVHPASQEQGHGTSQDLAAGTRESLKPGWCRSAVGSLYYYYQHTAEVRWAVCGCGQCAPPPLHSRQDTRHQPALARDTYTRAPTWSTPMILHLPPATNCRTLLVRKFPIPSCR